MNTSEPLLAFIVGHSRGRTTWMSRCLKKHPDLAVFGETMYWGRKFLPPAQNGYFNREQVIHILIGFVKNKLNPPPTSTY